MNPLDVLIIAIISYYTIMGIFRGITRELTALVGVVVGFFVANWFHLTLAEHMSKWISDGAYLNILSYLALFSVVYIVFNIAGLIIKYLLKKIKLSWIERLVGAAIALLKSVLMVSVLLVVLVAFLNQGTPVIRDSKLSPHVLIISQHLGKIVPDDMRTKFGQNMAHLEQSAKNDFSQRRRAAE